MSAEDRLPEVTSVGDEALDVRSSPAPSPALDCKPTGSCLDRLPDGLAFARLSIELSRRVLEDDDEGSGMSLV
jgi:hypothetical protein